jgi:DNA-3-methyladenine glycosylase I
MSELVRCSWGDGYCQAYHDEEWGVPSHDDRHLFEMLILEGAQAGLSWVTILKRRETYRAAFDNFEPAKVAVYDDGRKALLLQDTGIIRNRAKIESAVANANAFQAIQKEFGSFAQFLWGFTGGGPIQNQWATPSDVPVSTPLSDGLSKELQRRGFNFVGTTICYSFMQAVGMVNDHLVTCFRHQELS